MNMLTAPRDAADSKDMDLEKDSSVITTEHMDITEANKNKNKENGGSGDKNSGKNKWGWKKVFGVGLKRGGKDVYVGEAVGRVSVPERVAQLEAEMLEEEEEEEGSDGRKEEKDVGQDGGKVPIPIVSLDEFMVGKKSGNVRRRFLLF